MKFASRVRNLKPRRTHSERSYRPSTEQFETRQLMAANAFLQGTSYIDGNNDGVYGIGDSPLQGATIQLYRRTSPSTYAQIGSTTTDAAGGYYFDNANLNIGETLTPGAYRLVELAPGAFVSSASSAQSVLNQATAVDAKTIDVTLVDPAAVWARFDGNASYIRVSFSLTGAASNPMTDRAGVYNISLGDSSATPANLSASYNSFCTNALESLTAIGNVFQVNPKLATSPNLNTNGNGARIAFLYNDFLGKYGTTPSSSIPAEIAAGYQVAIWELVHDASPNLTSGNYSNVNGLSGNATLDAAIITQANYLLTNSAGMSGKATYLEAVATTGGRQSQLAPNSLNFGNVALQPSSLSGYVYADANNDGVFQNTELPIANVPVTLTGTNDLGQPVSINGFTNAAGLYSFTNLRPGTYTITETQPNGYLDGKDTIGTPGGATANDVFSNIVLGAGVNGVNNNFGELNPASLSGYVYIDSNNDGSRAGDTPIGGVTVKLTGTDDLGQPVSLTTTTLSSGNVGFYSFTNLRPGTYVITETQPADLLDGKDTIGTPGGTTANDVFSNIVLTSGVNGTENNFGELLPASLSGFVYKDVNNNGVKESGDSGIPNATVKLTGTDDLGQPVSVTITTDANGFYQFTGLRPGTYAITETQPNGYLDGKDTIGTPGGSTANDVFSNIVLGAGVSGVNNNFGEILASSLAGYVYYDANNDGIFQGTEAPIVGVPVTLTGTDDLGNPVSVAGVTNANGYYSFTGLRPGTYTITETQPGGFLDGKDSIGTPGGVTSNDVFSNIVLGAGVSGFDNNFGELKAASLSGFVYHDANNDGSRVGDAGIGGVTVTLTGTDDLGNPVNLSTTTSNISAILGYYSFTGLRPGTYVITESQPSGYLDGKDTIGTPGSGNGGVTNPDQFANILLNAGVDGINNNFGEILASSISGYVYYDANNNGSRTGDVGIGGVTVTLTGTNDLGQPVNLTTTTSVASATLGFYSFTGLRPGTYKLTETQPSAYLDGTDTIGTPGGTTANDEFSAIVLPTNFNGTENNFGELLPASLSGYVYNDANNNGLKETGEAGIPNAFVTLTGTDDKGAVNITVQTGPDGKYNFPNLRPGTYVITETQPGGFLDGQDTVGTPGGTTTNDKFSAVVLNAGVDGVNNNFGEILASSLSGYVYYDADNDGVFDSNEDPISGASVTLTGTDDLGNPVSIPGTTDADGLYSFTNLRPGTYKIVETQPGGFLDGKDTIGTPGGTTGADQFSAIVLGTGVNGVNNNFGEILASSLSGYVYYDANDDGAFDSNESPISGVKVFLTGTNDLGQPVSLTATTDATGFYSFTGLRPGTYAIAETQPSAYLDGKDTIGTPGGSTANDVFSNIVLNAGVDGEDNNFGELLPASISGYVYIDVNNDGLRAGDLGIGGVTVTLTGTDDLGNPVSLTTTTATSGNIGFYSFTNLRPGTYVVTETQPSAYTDGKDTVGTPFTATLGNDVFSAIDIFAGGAGVEYNFGELLNNPSSPPGMISGKKVIDVTGNGLSSDDTAPTVAFTIKLYRDVNNNGLLESTDTYITATSTTVGGSNPGSYSFGNLPLGNYIVREIVPAGYVRTAPTYNDYYSVKLTSAAPSASNLNFANFVKDCCCDPCNLYFLIYSDGCTSPTKVYDLRGNVDQGDLVKAVFSVPWGSKDEYTLVSYTAPQSYFDANRASEQKIFDVATGTFTSGTYSLTVQVPNSNFQIDFVCGKAIDKFGPAGSNIFYSAQCRLISADNDGSNAPLANPGSLAGNVYIDVDQDGIRDAGEKGIANVPVYLTGTVFYPGSSTAKTVNLVRFTDANGKYDFKGLPKGTYKIVESQPAGYTSTRTMVGKVNGITDGYISSNTSNTISSITLNEGEVGLDYNYGEIVTKNICSGQNATSYYWKSWDGQNLIKCFNGGSTSTKLGNWLASCFPNLYGRSSACDLTGKTNAQVCSYYLQICGSWGKDAERECFAAALNCYATTSWLGGKEGCNYGFSVCDQGLGGVQINVGCYGSSIGCSNYSSQTVYNCLKMVNDQSTGGKFCGGSSSRRSSVYNMFNSVNCS